MKTQGQKLKNQGIDILQAPIYKKGSKTQGECFRKYFIRSRICVRFYFTLVNMRSNPLDSMFSSHFENNEIYEPQMRHQAQSELNFPSQPPKKEPDMFQNEIINILPEHVNSLDNFFNSINKKIGILFIYDQKNPDLLSHAIGKIYGDPEIISILKHQFVTYAMTSISSEVKNISMFNRRVPCCLFMYNPLNKDKSSPSIIVDSLEGAENLDKLTVLIYNSLSNKENYEHGQKMQVEEPEDNSHSSIIQQQQQELKELEKVEEENRLRFKRQEEEKKAKEREERERREKEEQEQRHKEQQKKQNKMIIPKEPVNGERNSTNILFRFPDGENSVERRFYKTDKIEDLYNFIGSLDGINFNNAEDKFDLVQPFPLSVYSDKIKTLEEAKLYPNALVQVREHDNE